MGREAKRTRITIDGVEHEGDAMLESDELWLKIAGEPKRRKLPLSALSAVRGHGTSLALTHEGHTLAIEVSDAARWAERITSPPTLLDKLGVTRGAAVHVVGLSSEKGFLAQLEAAEVVRVPLARATSIVIAGITTRAQLQLIAKARAAVGDGLRLWVVYPRGTAALTEAHVRAAAIAEGLVDVKVARFSETRSALCVVVRKSKRATAEKTEKTRA